MRTAVTEFLNQPTSTNNNTSLEAIMEHGKQETTNTILHLSHKSEKRRQKQSSNKNSRYVYQIIQDNDFDSGIGKQRTLTSEVVKS